MVQKFSSSVGLSPVRELLNQNHTRIIDFYLSFRIRSSQKWVLQGSANFGFGTLERDDFSSNRHPALSFCLSMIFSENRYPLFRIMLELLLGGSQTDGLRAHLFEKFGVDELLEVDRFGQLPQSLQLFLNRHKILQRVVIEPNIEPQLMHQVFS